MFSRLKDWLSGRKTYLTAAIGILGGLAAWTEGAVTDKELIGLILAALTACFMRAGVTKAGPP